MTKSVVMGMLSRNVVTLNLSADEIDALIQEVGRAWNEQVGIRFAVTTPQRTILINLLHVETVEIR